MKWFGFVKKLFNLFSFGDERKWKLNKKEKIKEGRTIWYFDLSEGGPGCMTVEEIRRTFLSKEQEE